MALETVQVGYEDTEYAYSAKGKSRRGVEGTGASFEAELFAHSDRAEHISDGDKASNVSGGSTEDKETALDYWSVIREKIKEMSEKMQNGQTEPTYQIGAQSFTEKEWDKLMSDYDAMQDAVKELMRDRHEEREEKLEKQEQIEDDIAEKKAMKATIKGTQHVVYRDALFSICHVPTGETANVYRADNYSEDNPVYIVKGKDISGNDYEQVINVNDVDLCNCSYVEMLVWNVHTGNTGDFLKLARMRDEAGSSSFLDSTNYVEIVGKLLEEMKAAGAMDDYLFYLTLQSWSKSKL